MRKCSGAWFITITLIVLCAKQLDAAPPQPNARSVTNEDIRDAILSLVHMLRSIEDKLERHEFRERALADHIKKQFITIDKRIKLFEPLKGTISRLDERLAQVETVLIQKDNDSMLLEKLDKVDANIGKMHASIEERLKDSAPTNDNNNNNKINDGFVEEFKDVLNDVKNDVKDEFNKAFKAQTTNLEAIQTTLGAINTTLTDNHNNITNSILDKHTNLTDVMENIHANHTNRTDTIQTQLKQIAANLTNLNKLETILIQTGDGVMDSKRRIEYGIHQIVHEVTQLVKTQHEKLNETIERRFDEFELQETTMLSNLSDKISVEIDQVWRQIGIMYGEMKASGDLLVNLKSENDQYLNGTRGVMENMKGKVGQITSHVSEVDENLNYLLGRLSLVTQDFNQIKTGLGKALDEIRSSFVEVQEKIKDSGPGPHKIAESDEEGGTK